MVFHIPPPKGSLWPPQGIPKIRSPAAPAKLQPIEAPAVLEAEVDVQRLPPGARISTSPGLGHWESRQCAWCLRRAANGALAEPEDRMKIIFQTEQPKSFLH